MSQEKVTPVRGNRRITVTAALATALALVLTGVQLTGPALAKSAPATTSVQRAPAPLGSFADLVEAVAPAVVNISTQGKAAAAFSGIPDFALPPESPFREFFERHFRDRAPGRGGSGVERQVQAQGSGFIIDPSGFVVTNYHVIKNADEITVITHSGDRYPASLRGYDSKTDLAVVKVEAQQDLPYVEFGNSEQARVGDWVVAIGNPFGLGGTATTGIISARGRDIRSGPLDDFLQIDAPINRGNSGGPLFDTEGRVIGVNTAIFSPNGGSVGIGFAIPAELARSVVQQLKDNGVVERGWLGVQIQTVDEEIAASLGLDEKQGALVAGVMDDSPAAAAGLRPGDVVTRYNDQPVKRMRDLPRLVAETPIGETVAVELWRNGESVDAKVEIGRSEEPQQMAAVDGDTSTPAPVKLGVGLVSLTPETRARFRIDDAVKGVVVTEVLPDSPAAHKGLRQGDVIKMAGGNEVSSPGDVAAAVSRAVEQSRDALLLLVSRAGNDRFIAVKLA